ncbi:MAG: LTA synthase family protein [Dokdonella sp.]
MLLLNLLAFLGLGLGLSAVVVVSLDPAFLPADGASMAADSASLLLNAIPPALVAILLLALTRRGALSLLIMLSLMVAVHAVNSAKLELLDTPPLPGDFQFLAHLGQDAALLSRYVSATQLALSACIAMTCALLLYFESPWTALSGRRRAMLLVAALFANGTLLLKLQPWSTVYAAPLKGFEAWSPASSVARDGVIVTLLNYNWRMNYASVHVNHAATTGILRRHPLPPPVPEPVELPDIIVLQSESLFDPARLRGVDEGILLPQLQHLMRSNRHGDLWVPAFGGGTIRTEFEVLTGLAMRSFPEVEYPYFSLAISGTVSSLASVLGQKGYRTIAVHPNSRDFWNRASAFGRLGFEEFDAAEQFVDANRIGYYPSDADLVDHVLARLDETKGPSFIFAISIENHGPYDDFPNADPDHLAAQPVPANLTASAAARLRGYFYHLENADRELGRLAEALRGRSRPSLLLFYGDHLPALPRIYSELGFEDGASGPLQPVPWLLVDSQRSHPTANSESTASFYLPALLLDAAGIDDRGYFRLLESLRRVDSPKGGWTPNEDQGLVALMQLQQRGQLSVQP